MTDRSRLRLFVLQVLVLRLLATLLGRLWYLQVVTGSEYTAAAESNRVREIVTQAARGMILDDVGRPLVRNRTALVVSVNRSLLPRSTEDRAAVLARLSPVIEVPVAELEARITPCGPQVAGKPCYNGSPYQPVPVKEDAPPAMALQIEEHRELFTGVTAQFEAVREFPQRTGLAAHLLGYLSGVSRGRAGQGQGPRAAAQRPGRTGRAGGAVRRGAARPDRRAGGLRRPRRHRHRGALGDPAVARATTSCSTSTPTCSRPPRTRWPRAVDQARTRTENSGPLRGQHYKADSGAAVVLDADTGAVVAMASYPSYDPSVWVGGISQADFSPPHRPRVGGAADEPRHPGPVRARLDLQARHDRGGRAGRLLARTASTPAPGRTRSAPPRRRTSRARRWATSRCAPR